jgi:uncharacterized membrane protein
MATDVARQQRGSRRPARRGLQARATGVRGGNAQRLAKGLGWFSLALGLAETFAPRTVTRAIGAGGTRTSRTITRLCGLREMASGIGILTTPRPARWMTARVAGDVMDLALLAMASASRHVRRPRMLVATTSVAAATVLDATCAEQLRGGTGRTTRVTRSITVSRPASELYQFWRDFSNLPRVMEVVESVRQTGEGRWHWVARVAGMRLEWDSEVTEDRPNERIAWRSLPGARLATSGVVYFEPAPGGRGTEVTVEMEYALPGGAVTAQLATLLGQAPEQRVQEDLRRFKQLMETGEVVAAQPAQRAARDRRSGARGGAR